MKTPPCTKINRDQTAAPAVGPWRMETQELIARAERVKKRGQSVTDEGRHLRVEARRIAARLEQTQSHIVWLIDHLRRLDRSYHRPLREAIQAMHGCEAEHLASFAVRKVDGETVVWDGVVEEFTLRGHPQASRCYAWQHPVEGRVQRFSLLKLPPVDSPQRAVQMALAAHALGQQLPEEALPGVREEAGVSPRQNGKAGSRRARARCLKASN